MKKLCMLITVLSIVFLVVGTPPSVFGQSDDLEMNILETDDFDDDSDISILGKPDELLGNRQKGILIVKNQSAYCADLVLDGQKFDANLQPGSQAKITKIPYGSHTFKADECTGANIHWNPVTYTQGRKYTITLK